MTLTIIVRRSCDCCRLLQLSILVFMMVYHNLCAAETGFPLNGVFATDRSRLLNFCISNYGIGLFIMVMFSVNELLSLMHSTLLGLLAHMKQLVWLSAVCCPCLVILISISIQNHI
jgi:hypothetical protein